ncbi:CASP-like protein 4D1 [Primulina huaijiensis]|uniref:CASP-like protein 4D1 n=1 Tax=Primulina huaijiensis TaxID=1492673 RepID=UPI003CC72E35
MARRAILNTIIFLRIFTLLALAASIVVMVLNKAKDVDGSEAMFYDIIGYRYVVAVGGVGVIYTLIQIPFAIYNVAQEKRWIHNGFIQEFDFYGDKVIAFLLATGVGVGFGISFEFQRFFHPIGEGKKYLNMANISTGILLAGFASMALLCIFSSLGWSSWNKGFFK